MENLNYYFCMDIQKQYSSRNCDVKSAHIINVVVKLFGDLSYYSVASRIFIHDCSASAQTNSMRKNLTDSSCKSTPKSWVKITVDTYRRHATRLTSVEYVMRDNHVVVIKTKGK